MNSCEIMGLEYFFPAYINFDKKWIGRYISPIRHILAIYSHSKYWLINTDSDKGFQEIQYFFSSSWVISSLAYILYVNRISLNIFLGMSMVGILQADVVLVEDGGYLSWTVPREGFCLERCKGPRRWRTRAGAMLVYFFSIFRLFVALVCDAVMKCRLIPWIP